MSEKIRLEVVREVESLENFHGKLSEVGGLDSPSAIEKMTFQRGKIEGLAVAYRLILGEDADITSQVLSKICGREVG